MFHCAKCRVDTNGHPTAGPQYGLTKKVILDGQEIRVTVGDGATSLSLTDLAIERGNDLFQARFGHPPAELRGTLIEDNKTIFQRAYLAELDAKVPPKEAAINAATKTPFGRARSDAGYQIDVEPFTEMTKIVYGDPPRVREVPNKIEVVARKK